MPKIFQQLPLELQCEWFSFLPLESSLALITLNGNLAELCGPSVKGQKLWKYCNDQLQPLLNELHKPAAYLEILTRLSKQVEIIAEKHEGMIDIQNYVQKTFDNIMRSIELAPTNVDEIVQLLPDFKKMKNFTSGWIAREQGIDADFVENFNETKSALIVPKIGPDHAEWKKFPQKIQSHIYEAYLRQLKAWRCEVENVQRRYQKSKHSHKELNAELQNHIDTLEELIKKSREEE